MKNRIEFQFVRGFRIIFLDKKRRNNFAIPESVYCCDNFNFEMVGIKLSPTLSFVLKDILDKKKLKSNSSIWEIVDLNAQYCCFINSGIIPYSGNKYLQLRDANNDPISNYPVALFNLNNDFIGFVNDKETLIVTWNNDSFNQTQGSIEDIGEDFIFKFNPL